MPAKKYGWRHQQARERVKRQVNAGLAVCARCGKPIIASTSWDLGHSDTDPTQYHGAEHRKCNRGHRPAKQRHPPRGGSATTTRSAAGDHKSRDWGGGCIRNPAAE